MDLYPYNALNLDQRADHLWSSGVFISACRKREPFVLYYMIKDLYVELEYDAKQVKMLGLAAFKAGERYERMLEAIDLQRLLAG